MAGRIHIRRARPEDLIAVRELWRQVSAEVGVGEPPPTGDGRLFVAHRGRQLVGCALVALEPDRAARITDVAVAQDARSRGVGRALVEAAVAWARDRDVCSVIVDAAEVALGFWHAVGFEGAGTRLQRPAIKPADSLTPTERPG